MKFQQYASWLLIGFVALTGCGQSEPVKVETPRVDPGRGHLLQAQPKLPTIQLFLGNPSAPLSEMQRVTAEIARKPVEIATGMMFRTNMADGEAMLFVFADAAPRNFYMRNCFVPLSGAYISPTGEILQIFDMQPHDERGVSSFSRNVQFVLEVPQGWFARHNVSVGAIVRAEEGSLRETFFPKKP